MKENIIIRNLFRLLRAGAFGDRLALEPMSAFKWRRLYQMVEVQKVIPYFCKGVTLHQGEEALNLPKDLVEVIGQLNESDRKMPSLQLTKEEKDSRMANFLLNKRMKKIIHNELHSMDTSIEALDVLRMIIANTETMLSRGMNIGGMIRLGLFLRTKGDKVDFIKLENWLEELHLKNMAQLQGNILIEMFNFDSDELPFVHKEDLRARKLTLIAVSHLAKDTAEEALFRQTRTGFVSNNSTVLWRNMKRSFRYFGYARLETVSSFFYNLGQSLSQIEE